jgi:hypothetical protein
MKRLETKSKIEAEAWRNFDDWWEAQEAWSEDRRWFNGFIEISEVKEKEEPKKSLETSGKCQSEKRKVSENWK